MVALKPLVGRGLNPEATLRLYYDWGLKLLQGQVPYRDFPLEYPPLALVPFSLPLLGALGQPIGYRTYASLFPFENALLSTLIALVLVQVAVRWQPPLRVVPVLGVYALFLAACAPLLPWRFDLFPALLTLLALLCVLAGRPTLAGCCLGLGLAAKLYPVLLLPIFAIYYLVARERRALCRLLLGSAAAIFLSLLPVMLLAPGEWLFFLRFRQQQGLQIETLAAGAISLAKLLGLTSARVEYDYHADQLVSPQADVVLQWQPAVLVLALGALYVRCLMRFRHERAMTGAISCLSLVANSAAALLAFQATSRVLSPQYMVWLLPFAPLLRPLHSGVLFVICAATSLLYPFNYAGLVALHPFPVLLLNVRNVLVLALIALLLADGLRASAHAHPPPRRAAPG